MGVTSGSSINVPSPNPSTEVKVRRDLTFIGGSSIIVGTVIGTGIFISPSEVLRFSGSVGWSLIIWFICGVITLLSTLTYAELGTLIPKSGGTYIYLLEGFAPRRHQERSWWRPLPAFLYNWMNTILVKPASLVILCLISAQYLTRLGSPMCSKYDQYLLVKIIAVLLMFLVSFVNYFSISAVSKIQNVFTSLKLIAISLVIIGGIVSLLNGNTEQFQNSFESYRDVTSDDITSSFYAGFYAYVGWKSLNNVTKELKNPSRDLPRSIFFANTIVILCYLSANVSYLSVLTIEELLESDTVAVTFGGKLAGYTGEFIMIFLVSIGALGSAFVLGMGSGRITYASAKEGHLPAILAYIHKDYCIPSSAIVFNLILALILIIPANIGSLIRSLIFADQFYNVLTMVALLYMRYTMKHNYRAIKVHMTIPIVLLGVSSFLFLVPLISRPRMEYLNVVGVIGSGLFVYFPFVYCKLKVPLTDKLYSSIQKILHVLPENDSETKYEN